MYGLGKISETEGAFAGFADKMFVGYKYYDVQIKSMTYTIYMCPYLTRCLVLIGYDKEWLAQY